MHCLLPGNSRGSEHATEHEGEQQQPRQRRQGPRQVVEQQPQARGPLGQPAPEGVKPITGGLHLNLDDGGAAGAGGNT